MDERKTSWLRMLGRLWGRTHQGQRTMDQLEKAVEEEGKRIAEQMKLGPRMFPDRNQPYFGPEPTTPCPDVSPVPTSGVRGGGHRPAPGPALVNVVPPPGGSTAIRPRPRIRFGDSSFVDLPLDCPPATRINASGWTTKPSPNAKILRFVIPDNELVPWSKKEIPRSAPAFVERHNGPVEWFDSLMEGGRVFRVAVEPKPHKPGTRWSSMGQGKRRQP